MRRVGKGDDTMRNSGWMRFGAIAVFAYALSIVGSSTFAADHVNGQVLGGGAPIARSTVVLWEASVGAPKKLGETKTDEHGRFEIRSAVTRSGDTTLYITASGGEPTAHKGSSEDPAIALLAVLGNKAPARVTVNEFMTLASVVTHTQFLNGNAIQGRALALRIAAGNVPSFVNLETGGYGGTIQDALNSGQTPTMANFSTLANTLAGCVTMIRSDACSSLFYAATSPTGAYPKDTLAAIESIVLNASYQANRVFGLLNYFYPVPKGKTLRPTPFMPYLTFAPSAWIFPLKFTGGGLSGPGKLMIDSEGNIWRRQLHCRSTKPGCFVGRKSFKIRA